MRYRIVPQTDGKFIVEYTYALTWWWRENIHRLQRDTPYYWETIVFDTVEEARKAINEEKENRRREDLREKEFKDWKRKNKPIYV